MTKNLVLGGVFLSMCLAWLQSWQNRHYNEWIPGFGKSVYYTLDYKGYHHNQEGV